MAVTENIDEVVKTASSADLSVLSLVASADFVGKSVLIILAICSIWSWAIVIFKHLKFKSIKRKSASFEKIFWSGQVLDDLYEKYRNKSADPLSRIFVGAMDEYKKNTKLNIKSDKLLQASVKDRILQAMNIAKNKSFEELESRLGFLATVGSSAVFIGLFGTVWGIIHSFQSIAASKNTSLAVVAPGIAEALVATAVGLFVAIPATIFFNYLSAEIDKIYNNSEDFIMELHKLLSRAIDEENQ